MIGEFSMTQSQVTIQFAPGTPPSDPRNLTRVHIRSNADLGFRLALIPGPSQGLDSGTEPAKRPARPPKMAVRTWRDGTEMPEGAESLEVKPEGVVLRDSHSPMSLAEPVDLLVEFTVQDNFGANAGAYRTDYQVVFEPRFSRAAPRN
jgi:hypothetical protein